MSNLSTTSKTCSGVGGLVLGMSMEAGGGDGGVLIDSWLRADQLCSTVGDVKGRVNFCWREGV